ncbi:hypothetical protein [Caballeronia sp. HLA56]
MNVRQTEKSLTISSTFDEATRVRAYEIKFCYPGFRTKEHLRAYEVNVGTLTLSYSPRRRLIEFESFRKYLLSFENKAITLEEAALTVVDDVFTDVEPLACSIVVACKLNDGLKVFITAKRGWQDCLSVHQLIHNDGGLYL